MQHNIVHINDVTEFSKTPLTGNTILRYEAPNGVIGYQFPQDNFIKPELTRSNVIELQNGTYIPGGKQYFQLTGMKG